MILEQVKHSNRQILIKIEKKRKWCTLEGVLNHRIYRYILDNAEAAVLNSQWVQSLENRKSKRFSKFKVLWFTSYIFSQKKRFKHRKTTSLGSENVLFRENSFIQTWTYRKTYTDKDGSVVAQYFRISLAKKCNHMITLWIRSVVPNFNEIGTKIDLYFLTIVKCF